MIQAAEDRESVDAAEAILDLCERGREEAEVLRRNHDERGARIVENWMERIEAVVRETSSEWIPLPDVQRVTGWSDAWLRERAEEYAEESRARKRAGIWHFRRDVVREIPVKPGVSQAIEESDPEEVSRMLADLE